MSTSNAAATLLERVAREKTVRLVSRGRRTGIPREVTIWFVVDGDGVGLGTLNDRRNWVRNARNAGEVELVFSSGRVRGRFADVTDAATHERIRRTMARKYLPFRIASWFGVGQKSTFRVDALETATP